MAHVTVIFGGQEQGDHQIEKDRVVVGREPTCEIQIDNLGISRQHCAFVKKSDAYVVQDMGSANGTYVNGKKIVEHFLNHGDEVVIGKYTLTFNNEQQAAAKAERDESVVPDTLNTYVMDGAKIQEQLAKMRADKGETASAAAGGAPTAAAAEPGKAPTAKDYAKAMDVPPASGGDAQGLKTLLIVAIGGIFLLLIVLIVVLLLK